MAVFLTYLRLDPVEILVNNASGWLANSFLPDPRTGSAGPCGRSTPKATTGGSPWTHGPRLC